ncbi:MAG TPA: NAD-dependent epimerase/dehydratase family protein [Bryobacteraceae bacterium]|jgi:CDP-paratose 2-epimerase|nr:NAD-dependent epimerase/dehydratase family protein [Bryobacteraceae bacterium]
MKQSIRPKKDRESGSCAGQRQPAIGLVERFRPGEFERVEKVLADLRALRVTEVRTMVSWADWYTSEGDGWYAWLLPHLAKSVRLLPCFVNTPPCLGMVPKYSSPPQTPKLYADFIDVMITRFGDLFDWVELWNRPSDQSEWDSRLDPEWRIFSEMIGGAAYWAHKRGKKMVLPGLRPADAGWLEMMRDRGVLRYIDAVGLEGFPGMPEYPWRGWRREAEDTREVLNRLGVEAQIWITATGFSTWRDDERAQVQAFADAVNAPVDRIYWQESQDHVSSAADVFHTDEREYHYGLRRTNGRPKLLHSLWSEGGVEGVRTAARAAARPRANTGGRRHTLITGGAGFIGVNLAHRLLSGGTPVIIYDDLSRPGVERNLAWLREEHGELLRVEVADVRDREALQGVVRSAERVFHFAAQVAVTTSLNDPVQDFEINVGGTLNLLEAIRGMENPPPLLFTSTNKVYGALDGLALEKSGTRYQPLDAALRAGVGEEQPLDFHSPYGCSKGAADQYVLDYARTFGMSAVVFRMSCIYGPHQMGTEDQGWVAHFLIRALGGKPIVLYGDGKQVRDLLYVDDLVDAFVLALTNIHTLSGQAFNIGGGLGNTLSLLELLDIIGTVHGSRPEVRMESWRCADQRYYVSDTRRFKAATGWSPKVNARQGIERLYQWLAGTRSLTAQAALSTAGGMHAFLPH